MLFLRLLCYLVDRPFEVFHRLNQQQNAEDYEKALYEVVKFGERHQFEAELTIILNQLSFDPDSRLTPEKLFNLIQNEHL